MPYTRMTEGFDDELMNLIDLVRLNTVILATTTNPPLLSDSLSLHLLTYFVLQITILLACRKAHDLQAKYE